MKEISELTVKQYRIFEPDRVPFAVLQTSEGTKALVERFGWKETLAIPIGNELLFKGGAVRLGPDEPMIAVPTLQINARRIVLEVADDSGRAHAVYSIVLETLGELDKKDGQWKDAEPVIVTHETTCAVTLDFDWTALLAVPLRGFVTNTLVPALSSEVAEAEVRGLRFAIPLGYNIKDSRITEHGITLATKNFAVEPREGAPLSKRRYWTVSATDSETHLRLVREFEHAIRENAT